MRFLLRVLGMGIFTGGLTFSAMAEDMAGDIARIHVEAIGGVARVERLHSLRAAGTIRLGERELEFQMWAARPKRIRIEMTQGHITLVQAWDGENAPWLQEGTDGQLIEMTGKSAEDFKAESDFDDPLYLTRERGYTLEYAGEGEVDGRSVVKLLVTRSLSDLVTLYLASDTYFIVRQDRSQRSANGMVKETQTYFDEFRPVLGVIMPHTVVVKSGETVINETTLNWIEPNPPAEASLYQKPAA